MSKPLSFRSAVSAFVAASLLAGCATTQPKTSFGGKADDVNVGLATRALMALNAKDVPAAIDFAERAVEKNPTDAGFRAILGNSYFAAGRFSSAESAYKDALTIYSNQPQVILKLALVETALGKKDQAVAFLQAGSSVLDPSNYGLALALAGRPVDAIGVLENAARNQGADATVRQNLALAHALAGDWTQARIIAAQDVPADKLDARIHQWMQLAGPQKPADQVAALVGVSPAAVDNGQPVRLALRKDDTMMAAASPAPPAPVAQAAPAPVAVAAATPPAVVVAATPLPVDTATAAPEVVPAPSFVEAVAVPATEPAPTPAVAPATVAKLAPAVTPVIAEASLPLPVAMLAAAARSMPTIVHALAPKKAPAVRHANAHRVTRPVVGPGDAIVQLGAYRSPQNLQAAWTKLTRRHPQLGHYLPLRARFTTSKGTVWRLSIQGFSSHREAAARCNLLKGNGGQCFVRNFAGDVPVQIAMN